LHFEKADDGIFWINIEDFVENFGQICACKYNKNYISTSLDLAFSKDEEK
jgi:calpain-15